MSIEVTNTELVQAVKEQNEAVRQSALATRVTNALLLAKAMNLDITQPLEAQKVLRHLSRIERHVGSGSND